jgi:hypothetical protein
MAFAGSVVTLINLIATRMFWRDGAGTAAKARQAA